MTDMRTLMRDQCALAIVYAEDGAYSRAGEILTELAQAVNAHAERNIAMFAGLEIVENPDLPADVVAVVTPASAQQIFNAGMDVLNRVTPGPTISDMIKSVRKGWQARPDGSFDHDSKRLKVKGARRDLLKPWYIMTNSIPGRSDFIQVRRRYYATAEAAMIAAEKIIH